MDGGEMSSYDHDTGSAFLGCTRYKLNGANFIVRDDSHESVGVYRWGWAGDVLKLDVVEDPDPEGPMGAKGVGEIGLVPTAAAVAGALEAFDGIRRCRLPMRDSPAAQAMSVLRKT
jgi:hypothetical protein